MQISLSAQTINQIWRYSKWMIHLIFQVTIMKDYNNKYCWNNSAMMRGRCEEEKSWICTHSLFWSKDLRFNHEIINVNNKRLIFYNLVEKSFPKHAGKQRSYKQKKKTDKSDSDIKKQTAQKTNNLKDQYYSVVSVAKQLLFYSTAVWETLHYHFGE